MKPIVDFPAASAQHELVRSSKNEQLWRCTLDGEPAALRLFRFEGARPLIDPIEIIARTGEIVARLDLEATAPLLEIGRAGDGYFIAERWIDDRSTDLGRVVRDLLRLHRAGKWHGGVRPSRIVGGTLVALTWSMFLTTLTREARASIGDDRLAPELVEHGPRAAGPANDVYGFATVLAARGMSSPLIDRARSVDPGERPSFRELIAVLADPVSRPEARGGSRKR